LNVGTTRCIENDRFLLDDVSAFDRSRGERSGGRGHRNAEDFQILKMMPKPKVMVWADLEIANPYLI
jgi:hypothetical protein